MITIVAGTNRPLSKTIELSHYYRQLLARRGAENQILDLAKLPADFTYTALYDRAGQNKQFNSLHDLVEASDKFVFVVPEYNSSFPGVFKAFLDGLSYPSPLLNKKCALVGLSDGVMGNALGLSHLTDVLNYLGMNVMAQKVRIPTMKKNFVKGKITDTFIEQLIEDQAELLFILIKMFSLIDLCFLRVMASGIMIAVGRSAGDLSTMSAVRFQIYALSILILIYLMLLRWAGSQRRGRSVLVGMMVMGSTVLSGYSYIKYGSTVQELEKKLKADTYNYTHHHKFLHQYSNLVDPSPEFYRHYTFPEYFGQSMIARWHQTNEPSGAAITSHVILASDVTNDHIYNTMEFEVRNVPAHVEEESLYLTFENRIDSSEFYILGLNARRSWLLDAISEKVDRVFYATTLLKMPQGDYQARINWIENGEPKGIAVTADIHL